MFEENLFQVLESGDKKIQKLKDTATILVGGTRIGKSTLFNLLNGKMLIGRGKGLNTFYDLQSEDDGVAKISTSYKSETLAPNIRDPSQNESLIDMAGFGDTRNYIGVIGVSYFLHRIFQKVKRARFILVINEFGMADPTGAKLIQTFNGFIKMFRFDLMTPEIRTQLMNSLSLVVTKSTLLDYHPNLQNVIAQLQDETFQAQNRQLIIELVKSLLDSNRIEGFKASKANATPKEEERKFIDRFTNNLNWQYIDLEKANQTVGQSLIALPFSEEFDQLKENDRMGFESELAKKIKSYNCVSNILSAFLNTIIDNWKEMVLKWKTNPQEKLTLSKMNKAFEEVRNFLKEFDVYNSESTVTVQFKPSYDPPSLVSTISSIVKAFELSQAFNIDAYDDFKQKMKHVSDVYTDILNVFTPFCTNEDEEKLLAQINYIVRRGIIQCTTLNSLRKEIVSDFIFNLKDSIANAFEMYLKDFYEAFISQMTPELMPRVLSTFQDLLEYEKLLQNYENQFKFEQENPLFIPLQKCAIGSTKADLYIRSGQKINAFKSFETVLRNYLEMIRQMKEKAEGAPSTENNSEGKSSEISLFMNKRRVIFKMVNILTEIKPTDTFASLSHAISLSKEQNLAHQTFGIYEKILNSQNTPLEHKSQICLDYHNYLVEWGLLEQALAVLIRRQSIQTADFECYADSMQKISEFEDKKIEYMETFKKKSKSLMEDRGSDDNLLQILETIKSTMPEEKVVKAVEKLSTE